MSEKLKTFSEAMGGDEFYPDLPRKDFGDIQGKELLIQDCMLVEDFTGKFGTHDFLLIKCRTIPMGDTKEKAVEFTTITSGEVVIKRVTKAKKEGLLPLCGTFAKVDGKSYYNVL